eukprot:TRINITY_DN11568_c0_g1_i1.p1 TRINITY_DN11568_c0_g1~~TRINITY_DN11568_c0_g1_i1.p1  ORF type:complete len:621 (+),score=91.00 TRINITY_DN11568_c0_g1_i1:981-2843(+)
MQSHEASRFIAEPSLERMRSDVGPAMLTSPHQNVLRSQSDVTTSHYSPGQAASLFRGEKAGPNLEIDAVLPKKRGWIRLTKSTPTAPRATRGTSMDFDDDSSSGSGSGHVSSSPGTENASPSNHSQGRGSQSSKNWWRGTGSSMSSTPSDSPRVKLGQSSVNSPSHSVPPSPCSSSAPSKPSKPTKKLTPKSAKLAYMLREPGSGGAEAVKKLSKKIELQHQTITLSLDDLEVEDYNGEGGGSFSGRTAESSPCSPTFRKSSSRNSNELRREAGITKTKATVAKANSTRSSPRALDLDDGTGFNRKARAGSDALAMVNAKVVGLISSGSISPGSSTSSSVKETSKEFDRVETDFDGPKSDRVAYRATDIPSELEFGRAPLTFSSKEGGFVARADDSRIGGGWRVAEAWRRRSMDDPVWSPSRDPKEQVFSNGRSNLAATLSMECCALIREGSEYMSTNPSSGSIASTAGRSLSPSASSRSSMDRTEPTMPQGGIPQPSSTSSMLEELELMRKLTLDAERARLVAEERASSALRMSDLSVREIKETEKRLREQQKRTQLQLANERAKAALREVELARLMALEESHKAEMALIEMAGGEVGRRTTERSATGIEASDKRATCN